ncbi:MAG: efflux RND transporter periplasmic adaptor subunit, partial [Candidatus Methylomirabilales bacterium]
PPDAVLLSPIRQQLAGVRTGVVQVKDLEATVRTVGIVEYDERKVARIHPKIEGWIEKIFVDFTGKFVKKGDPLFSVYSPELVATQEEYLLALKAKRYLEGSPVQEVAKSGQSLLEAARRRLLLWDITEEQIQELEQTGKPKKSLMLYSPINGIVVKKEAYKGVFVKPEMELYTIADLSTIWIQADIYEYELPLIKVGQEATVSLSYYPGQVFKGKVIYIYPYLKDKTRTIRVRFEFPNTPDWKLKPEMFSNVEVKIKLGKKLAVPEEAVLDSGVRQIVFVAKGEGLFEPREVKLGAKVDNYYEVLSGLSKGEKVVTSANFLIDSESRLKAAMGAMPGHK